MGDFWWSTRGGSCRRVKRGQWPPGEWCGVKEMGIPRRSWENDLEAYGGLGRRSWALGGVGGGGVALLVE